MDQPPRPVAQLLPPSQIRKYYKCWHCHTAFSHLHELVAHENEVQKERALAKKKPPAAMDRLLATGSTEPVPKPTVENKEDASAIVDTGKQDNVYAFICSPKNRDQLPPSLVDQFQVPPENLSRYYVYNQNGFVHMQAMVCHQNEVQLERERGKAAELPYSEARMRILETGSTVPVPEPTVENKESHIPTTMGNLETGSAEPLLEPTNEKKESGIPMPMGNLADVQAFLFPPAK